MNDALATIDPPATANSPMMMLQSAIANGATPADCKDLIDLVSGVAAQKARADFSTAMNLAQQAMPCIVRDGFNPFLKTKYAKLETVNSLVKPVAARHGFSLSFSQADSPYGADWIRLVCDIYHTGGHVDQKHVDMPLDGAGMKGGQNKSGPQAVGATLTYARRNLLKLIFNLTEADEDLDGQAAASLDTITEADALEIEDLIRDKAVNLAKFLEWAEVKSIRDIRQVNVAKVFDTLNRKKAPGDR